MARTRFGELSSQLAEIGRRFYSRGWALGTSGNFSAVVSRQPLRLAITASSRPKGRLTAADILECDGEGRLVAPEGPRTGSRRASAGGRRLQPSAETLLHLEIARRRLADAVLHTHSVWTTVLSDLHASDGGFLIEGFEMLKGLDGVQSHEHREWIPIIQNDQDMSRLSARVGAALDRAPGAHGFVLVRHGLYTWGKALEDAERHVEILEFLFETVGRIAVVRRGQTAGTPLEGGGRGAARPEERSSTPDEPRNDGRSNTGPPTFEAEAAAREARHGKSENSGRRPHDRRHRVDWRIPRRAGH